MLNSAADKHPRSLHFRGMHFITITEEFFMANQATALSNDIHSYYYLVCQL
jgi:hypothetical protein